MERLSHIPNVPCLARGARARARASPTYSLQLFDKDGGVICCEWDRERGDGKAGRKDLAFGIVSAYMLASIIMWDWSVKRDSFVSSYNYN